MKELAATASPAEPVRLRAADGYPLCALRYRVTAPGATRGAGPGATPIAATAAQIAAATTAPLIGRLIVAGATGVPQRFYRRFAEHAAAQGFETLTLDYRGIGLSKPATLKRFRMDYLDWARLDLAAAVDTMASADVPLFMVGHSFGGHAFGLLPNHHRVARFYTFATGAGWHGWMPPLERLRVLAMWRVVGPLLTHWKGYLPWSLLGMGEDLPLNVYRQWRHWCRYPRYFFDDPAMPHLAERFAAVRTPIIAANALDDHWAPPRSRDAFMAAYRGVSWQAVDLDPRHEGLGPIGHMGYFRSAAMPLWDRALQWFAQHEQTASGDAPTWMRPAASA